MATNHNSNERARQGLPSSPTQPVGGRAPMMSAHSNLTWPVDRLCRMAKRGTFVTGCWPSEATIVCREARGHETGDRASPDPPLAGRLRGPGPAHALDLRGGLDHRRGGRWQLAVRAAATSRTTSPMPMAAAASAANPMNDRVLGDGVDGQRDAPPLGYGPATARPAGTRGPAAHPWECATRGDRRHRKRRRQQTARRPCDGEAGTRRVWWRGRHGHRARQSCRRAGGCRSRWSAHDHEADVTSEHPARRSAAHHVGPRRRCSATTGPWAGLPATTTTRRGDARCRTRCR